MKKKLSMLVAAVLLIGAAVAVPIFRKRAKVRKLYAGLEAENAVTEKENKSKGKK